MTTMIQRRNCTCDCGHTHVVEERVEMKELPIGIESTIVPNSQDSAWTVFITDHIKGNDIELPAVDMKGCLWIINNVARKLMRMGYRFVVNYKHSRFETHSRIAAISVNDFTESSPALTRRDLVSFEELSRRAGRQSVMGANRTHRNGYEN